MASIIERIQKLARLTLTIGRSFTFILANYTAELISALWTDIKAIQTLGNWSIRGKGFKKKSSGTLAYSIIELKLYVTCQTIFKRLALKATKPAHIALKIFEKVSVIADSTNFFTNADIATYTAWQAVKLNNIFIVINRATLNALIIFI